MNISAALPVSRDSSGSAKIDSVAFTTDLTSSRDSQLEMKKVRYAVAGLGHIAQVAVLPAFKNARNSALAALISGDRTKRRKLSEKYRTPAYHYEDFEKALKEQEIDAVYIALPNSLHREYTERAAAQGVHVLCEKPMATTERDCKAMLRAAEKNRVKLMIAYRLHFTDSNVEAVRLAQAGKLGELRVFNSVFTMQVEEGDIRLRQETGGGTLFDIGIYCINAARYLFRDEPEEVVAFAANSGQKRFSEVEEMIAAVMRFPKERLALFTCSFGAARNASFELVGTKGTLRVDPAYSYVGKMNWELTIDGKTQKKSFPPGDQFGPELYYFSECVLKNRVIEPDSREGMADVQIINAIYKSAKSGRPVRVKPLKPQRRPGPDQKIKRPPVKEPELVRADSPRPGD